MTVSTQSPDRTDIENPTTKEIVTEASYWNTFYADVGAVRVPSQFCIMVATEVDPRSTPVVEFGCGNGRDSLYFSSRGFRVIGSDLSETVIAENRAKAAPSVASSTSGGKSAESAARFSVCDVTDERMVGGLIEEAKALAGSTDNIVVYTRFFLHSIDRVQESQFVEGLSKSMIEGDKLYMEFRCHLDEDLIKVYGKSHYRRYVRTDDFVALLEKKGFTIQYQITGQGMAKYKNEDPFVSRVIAVKGPAATPA